MLQGVRDETVSVQILTATHTVVNSRSSDPRIAADTYHAQSRMRACEWNWNPAG